MSQYSHEHPENPFGNQPYFQRAESDRLSPPEGDYDDERDCKAGCHFVAGNGIQHEAGCPNG